GSFYLNQYHNPDNGEAHYLTTAPELWEQLEGRLDVFVTGLGTGGTMTGVGKFLKEKNPAIRNVGVDPVGSVYQGYFQTGKLPEPHVYKVEGIGEDMLCKALDFSVIDEIRQVDDQQCFNAARRLAREEGLFGGGSSGAAVHVAVEVARELGKGKVVVVVLTDTGNSYISKFFSDEWMKDNGFAVDEKSPGRVKDLVGSRKQHVLFAEKGQRIDAVVEQMRKHGISQMPVRDGHGGTLGMIHEYDLLNALVSKKQGFQDLIDPLIAPLQGVVSPEATLSRLREVFAQDNVAVVKEHEQVVAIVTKIDLIEYLAGRM
ncbi:MAG: pyridoxal-phosphate dependent enzyme, partial [Myxococcaceae bacterium]